MRSDLDWEKELKHLQFHTLFKSLSGVTPVVTNPPTGSKIKPAPSESSADESPAAPSRAVRITTERREGQRSARSAGSYIGAGSSHWVQSIIDEGNMIKLEDDSLWQVSPLDVINSALWLPISNVTVISGDDPPYPYKLINKDDNEVVNARLLSR